MTAQAVADVSSSREAASLTQESDWFRLAPQRERRCWCGGGLMHSAHELYGKCERCGTHVLERFFTPEELKAYYSLQGYWREHQQRDCGFPAIEQRAENDLHDRIPVWHQILTGFKPQIGSLLEIGCAHGGFLHYSRERGVRNVVGIEVDEETCRFARERFGLEHVCAGLFPDVALPFSSFDAIAGFDVIEHLADPISGIQKIASLLSEDGVFLFQTPCYRSEDAAWSQFKPSEHTFLYNASSARTLFERAGLELKHVLPGLFPDDMFLLGRRRSSATRHEATSAVRLGPEIATQLIEYVHGCHRPEGGFRWLQRKSLLKIPTDKLAFPMTLKFTLSAGDLWCYGNRPFEASVSIDGKQVLELSFARNQQQHEIALRFTPRRKPQEIKIECSAAFVPEQLDRRSKDQRQLALKLENLSLTRD